MFAKFFTSVLIGIGALFGWHDTGSTQGAQAPTLAGTSSEQISISDSDIPASTNESGRASVVAQLQASSNMPAAISEADLLSMAGNDYANGGVPLGDKKYTTSGPKKGYIYLCNVPGGNGGGAEVNGSWIHGSFWNPNEKISVQGSILWPNAQFSDTVSGDSRTLSSNGLPFGYATGIFPVSSSDPAYRIDRNPNSIQAHDIREVLPAHPKYLDTPQCMGMEVGVMLSGVPLLNGFDAELRDAVAHEVQDACDAHPQEQGHYHYHGLSSCFKDVSVSTVLGFALDGFPITGPQVATGKYLTTNDLDVCHGITSEVVLDGKKTVTYHYVLTQDFPYSASCFRAKPISLQVGGQTGGRSDNMSVTGQNRAQNQPSSTGTGRPPQAAIASCSGEAQGATCSFETPQGTISGACRSTPDGSVACVPAGR